MTNHTHVPRRSGAGARLVLIPGTRRPVLHRLSMKAAAARRRLRAELLERLAGGDR